MFDAVKKYLKTPHWPRQHGWRRAIWTFMSRLGLTGLHILPLYRRWIEIHWRDMPLVGLDPAFAGRKIVQISDLHYSPVVGARYLLQHIRWINELNPDLVVVTGDLITGGYRYAQRVATILSHLRPRFGVINTFGNHDYSIYGRNQSAEGSRRADFLERCLCDQGLTVLRNQPYHWRLDGAAAPLVIVGLDDEWSDHMDPEKAWAGVDPRHPIICLNHNPANCAELLQWPWQWMLSGHTHGRQVATSRFGRTFYPHRYRRYTHGYYNVEGRHLYVNRGLSYGQRLLHWCKPEITVFKLQVATDHPVATTATSTTIAIDPDANGNGNGDRAGD